MSLSQAFLQKFENELDPLDPTASKISCKILDYGEISTVLEVDGDETLAAKRMPLFSSQCSAEAYAVNYHQYCDRLREAGLFVPEDKTVIVNGNQNIVVLYILQKQLPPERFCHNLIHTEDDVTLQEIVDRIISEIEKVWTYNSENTPDLKLAIDGQLSNWVYLESGEMAFIDTSTPLMIEKGEEVLDPELLIQSAPSFLRWLIRWLFLDGVMNRYYEPRLVYTDLIANLFKEQHPDLVDPWIARINDLTSHHMAALERKDIESYYKEDKLIWIAFLALRRIDRFLKTRLLGQRYEFVLPGKIKR